MILTVSPFDPVGRSRIAQLINKSNQFNLTTIRRQEDEIRQIEESANHVGLQFRLLDRFGDNGMISVVILEIKDDTIEIDTWLMSCRVLERGVEEAVLNEITSLAATLGCSSVMGRFVSTDRNALVQDHYERLGFESVTDAAAKQGETLWQLAVDSFVPRQIHMQIERRNILN
jgi:FkbH-like protein